MREDCIKKFELGTQFCLYNGVALLSQSKNAVCFGLVNPDNTELKNRLERSARIFFERTDIECTFTQIDADELEKIVTRNYGCSSDSFISERIPEYDENSAGVLLLDSLIEEAAEKGASDIHIEENCVRYRINGRLEKACPLDVQRMLELVRRIKVLARMNVMEKRSGQDGQFIWKRKKRTVFIRVSCLPVISSYSEEGVESVVLRLLDTQRVNPELEGLGFDERQQEIIRRTACCKSGLVLISGPTGSGKTTTASAVLQWILKESEGTKKIITVEEPPEYILEGVTQIRLEETAKLDFDSALKYIFRHDPDVVFVGEIRDSLSAKTALRASLTGHLVFATVHTDGIFETLLRLCDLGLSLKTLCTVLKGVISQELDYKKNGEGWLPVLRAKVFETVPDLFEISDDESFGGKLKSIIDERCV